MINFLKRRLITYYVTNLTGSKTILSINYNFHAIMTSSNNRIKYIKNSGHEIKYGNKFRVFPTTKCATYLYWNGVSHRGLSIGSGYFLDSIIFKDGDIVIDCGANLGN